MGGGVAGGRGWSKTAAGKLDENRWAVSRDKPRRGTDSHRLSSRRSWDIKQVISEQPEMQKIDKCIKCVPNKMWGWETEGWETR